MRVSQISHPHTLTLNKNHRIEQGSRFKISQSSGTFCLGLCMCASWNGNCVTTAAMWDKLKELP